MTTNLLIVGSGARFAERLASECASADWDVTVLVSEDPVALPPTAWLPVESRDEHHDLIEASKRADAVVTLGGVGPATAIADDARTLDTVLAHLRPGKMLLALSSIAVFGDAGSIPLTEDMTPEPPDEFEPARASEIRVLAASDWLRTAVVRAGLVYADDGGDLVAQAVQTTSEHGVSRYFGHESDLLPTVHESDLLRLTTTLLGDQSASGVYHAVTGSVSMLGLAQLIATRAGVEAVAPWDRSSLEAVFGVTPGVPRINVNTDAARSRPATELGWGASGASLPAALTPS